MYQVEVGIMDKSAHDDVVVHVEYPYVDGFNVIVESLSVSTGMNRAFEDDEEKELVASSIAMAVKYLLKLCVVRGYSQDVFEKKVCEYISQSLQELYLVTS